MHDLSLYDIIDVLNDYSSARFIRLLHRSVEGMYQQNQFDSGYDDRHLKENLARFKEEVGFELKVVELRHTNLNRGYLVWKFISRDGWEDKERLFSLECTFADAWESFQLDDLEYMMEVKKGQEIIVRDGYVRHTHNDFTLSLAVIKDTIQQKYGFSNFKDALLSDDFFDVSTKTGWNFEMVKSDRDFGDYEGYVWVWSINGRLFQAYGSYSSEDGYDIWEGDLVNFIEVEEQQQISYVYVGKKK